MKIAKKIKNYIKANGLLLFFFLIIDRLRNFVVLFFKNFLWLKNGVYIGRNSTILGMNSISLGKKFYAKDGLWLDAVHFFNQQSFSPKITIGDNVSASKNLHIGCIISINIGDNTLIGSNVLIIDHNHGSYSYKNDFETKPIERDLIGKSITIGKNCWIGDNVVILPGVNIGDNIVIGANSVISKSIPSFCVVVGSQAKIIKKF